MNYYNEIKKELINNEIYKKAKDCSKNRSDLTTYYNVGRLLVDAQGGEERAKYGDNLIKKYAKKLTFELGKGYTSTALSRMRQFYIMNENFATVSQQLTWSHYVELLRFDSVDVINYYIKVCVEENLSVRELRTRIKNSYNYKEITEKLLKCLIIEDLDNFLMELGQGFTYVKSEYKIKLGTRYNYIALLLYNVKYSCYVVVELKVTELKKEHIGQIKLYMNYIDKNNKTIHQDKTIGTIICKTDNQFVMEYCSDDRILSRKYLLT